eukprot:TRINITY_DN14198_c0_g1_i1.p1 TRINITY_DN14198_c0_g1~~TRINITY_DN14198_c0_g1_i1.p1  ORF type:complete len:103 (+),score=0.67 TRINITY_DN14198_c0_g1_i1:157-465(+)
MEMSNAPRRGLSGLISTSQPGNASSKAFCSALALERYVPQELHLSILIFTRLVSDFCSVSGSLERDFLDEGSLGVLGAVFRFGMGFKSFTRIPHVLCVDTTA